MPGGPVGLAFVVVNEPVAGLAEPAPLLATTWTV